MRVDRKVVTAVADVALVLSALTTAAVVVVRTLRPATAAAADGASRFPGWKEDLRFDRRIGGADAPYRLVVWTDYQCPACSQFEQQLKLVREQLGDSLVVIYRYYPLAAHPLAFGAAIAAECARGQKHFPEMHAALFAAHLHGDSLPVAALMRAGGIPDTVAFKRCVTDSASAARSAVVADLARVPTLHLRGTPGVQIGDRIETGGMSAPELIQRLRTSAQ